MFKSRRVAVAGKSGFTMPSDLEASVMVLFPSRGQVYTQEVFFHTKQLCEDYRQWMIAAETDQIFLSPRSQRIISRDKRLIAALPEFQILSQLLGWEATGESDAVN